MGASTAHHGSPSAAQHDIHPTLRRRHERDFHLLDLVHSRRMRWFLWLLVLLAVALASYRIASNRGHDRLASKNREYRALLAEKRADEAALRLKLEREQHSIRINEDAIRAYERQSAASGEELERTSRSLASLRWQIASLETSIVQLEATLADKHSQTSERATELDRSREELGALKEERDRLRIEVQRLSSRLEDAAAELAEEQRLEGLRGSKP